MTNPSWRRCAGGNLVTIVGLLLALLPQEAAGARLDCRGVVTFADAMTRAVIMSVDPDRGTVHLPSCVRYGELHRFCYGDILRADDHRFHFGGVESFENTRLTVALYHDGSAAVEFDPSRLKVVFVGHCIP